MMKYKGLISGFCASVQQHPERPALEVNRHQYTYKELSQYAADIAAAIGVADRQVGGTAAKDYAALLAYRSLTAYAGILGILGSGKAYIPLNPASPLERLQRMLRMSEVDIIIADSECLHILESLLPSFDDPMTILLDNLAALSYLMPRFPKHRFLGFQPASNWMETAASLEVKPDATAYLLFTSGSTGIPKGVPVSHANGRAYVEYVCQHYEVNENDRFSQMFDMTFDLSVHDMFVAWERGACVYCVPEKYLMSPGEFIQNRRLTMWFSVPSVAMFMSGYRMLKPNTLPSLRYSLFCGEALSAVLADQWQKAAPHSVLENLYGPTEATIAIAHYRWDGVKSPPACVNGVVPIGWTFDGQFAAVIPVEGTLYEPSQGATIPRALVSPLCPPGEPGELCLSGSQVTRGYLNNPEKTSEQYILIPSQGEGLWYRTGDLVKQDEQGCLYYLGRIDNQVKVLGHRIELGEIDAVLREAAQTEMAVSIAWPVKDGRATGIVAFVAGKTSITEKAIQSQCLKRLPDYMVPRRVYFIESMPLNVNGKIDRLKLQENLEKT
jgi:amino acid adenylation domain-containing protein